MKRKRRIEIDSKRLSFLRGKFLEHAEVRDPYLGYIAVESFNICMDPEVLQTAASCIASEFLNSEIDVVFGIPQNGKYLGTAVALAFGRLGKNVKLHASSKGESVSGAWRDVFQGNVRSFTTKAQGERVNARINFASVESGSKVLLIDDVCACGDTAVTAILGMQEMGVEVVGFAVLFDKKFQGGLERVSELGVPVFSCVRVERIDHNNEIILSRA